MIIGSIAGAILSRNIINDSIISIPAMVNLFLSDLCRQEFEVLAVCTKNEFSQLFYKRSDGLFEIDFSSERQIPVRRCKKKRIQKKWKKKYGTKTVYTNKKTLLANNISVTESCDGMFGAPAVYVVFSGEF